MFFGITHHRRLLLLLLCMVLILKMQIDEFLKEIPFTTEDQRDLSHFEKSRNFKLYLDSVDVLIEPVNRCQENLDLVVSVSSAPNNIAKRNAIRQTWGKHLSTYFFLGLDYLNSNDQLNHNYIEAKKYNDIVVFNMKSHYQNLTLKTGIIMKWMRDNCGRAKFMMKADDDIVVIPWIFKNVMKKNMNNSLIGHKFKNKNVYRKNFSKWFMPRWMYPEKKIPQYLSGIAYLVKVSLLSDILKAAENVPMVNMEDVFFTYLVAVKILNLTLTHEPTICQLKVAYLYTFSYFNYAILHAEDDQQMLNIWQIISQRKI